MKFSQWFAICIMAVVACDVLLSMAGSAQPGKNTPRVSMLTMLQVGPQADSSKLVGGDDCPCAGIKDNKLCTQVEDSSTECVELASGCETPTSQQTADVKTKIDSESTECASFLSLGPCVERDVVIEDSGCEEVPPEDPPGGGA
jgi:hypothetical protein